MFEVKEIPVGNDWLGNLNDFYGWCQQEKRRLSPGGACAQSCSTLNGTVAFLNKYPTFEDAYKAYKEEIENMLRK